MRETNFATKQEGRTYPHEEGFLRRTSPHKMQDKQMPSICELQNKFKLETVIVKDKKKKIILQKEKV